MNTSLEVAALWQMKPLCGELQNALRYGCERADHVLQDDGLTADEHNWLRHHYARTMAGKRLRERKEEIAPWRVLPNQKTGSLQLVSGFNTVRVLRPLDGGVPAPGRNPRRRAFYAQPSIDGLTVDDAFPQLQTSRYIATWEVLDLETFDVGVQVFRTTGTFRFGDTSKIDLSFWLPDDADALDKLTFEPSDEGIDLPIPKEESGDEPIHG